MRLKRVRIFGFKTFADRTEFSLEGGIIAVVGPNGCGKSNLVDAILWGLGEGSARQLRAHTSQDVIFSGSAHRKPVGFTEVVLLFDNEDGALPIDSPEVSITRRLTRSGDSEYAINRKSCRLRDVHELLADSGLGRAGYSIVGQKEIDQALAASAEDRRAWVDEAAGVQRYRARKIESQRRLASASTHLQRVADIVGELEAQREPLREEAEVAARYKSAQTSLRAVESGLLIKEVVTAITEMEALQKRIDDSVKLGLDENIRAETLESEVRRCSEKIINLDREADGIRKALQDSISALERAQSEVRLGEERLRSLDELEASLTTPTSDDPSRIETASADLAAVRMEATAEREALEKLRIESAGAGIKSKALAGELKEVENRLAEARAIHAEKLKREADKAHRNERAKDAKRELAGITKSVPELQEALEAAKEAATSVNAEIKDSRDRVKQLETDLTGLRQQEEQDAQVIRRWLSERSALEGRQRGIEATIEAHEGLNQGARAVMEAKQRGVLSGNYLPVGEAIDVPQDLALAIETALGGSVNDLIVEREADAKAAIAWLKEHRLGRCTFQPIPLMRTYDTHSDLRRLLGEKGVVGRASELVECNKQDRPVIDSLLGRIVIVEDLDVSLRLAKTSGWSRMVTMDGEVVHSSGAVTGGHQAKQGYGLVQRKADLNKLEADILSLSKKITEAETRSKNFAKSKAGIETALKELNDLLSSKREQAEEANSYFQSLNDEWTSTVRSQQRIEAELTKLATVPEDELPDVDFHKIEAERDAVLKKLAAGSADAEQAEARLREMDQRVAQSEARLKAAERRLQAAEEDERHREKRLAHIGPERERIAGDIKHQQSRATTAAEEKAAAEAKLHQLQGQRTELQEQANAKSDEARKARDNAAAVGDATHQAELSRARADAKRAAAGQRLYEEYGVTEDDALEQGEGIEVPSDAPGLVARLRRELKSMGDVNLGAIEAFDRLTQRFDELEGQRADILEGIEQVNASISELDKLTRERFVNTFKEVQLAFAEIFTKLFGGGEGSIFLTDPASILDTGIEIEVTLPGKKRQRLELLSGGERALCASAFLFSLLQVKPSPLVILDEVDAPLDGRNVERFAALLQEFTKSTQFIVITHNPTTIESAPVWLGVTMQEPGVSTLVPARLPEKAVTNTTHALTGQAESQDLVNG